MNLLESIDFHVQVTGEKTGQTFVGNFSAYRRLSHRSELQRDRIYRELLGPNPQGASERAISQAEIIADLQVSLAKVPDWWKEANNGLELCDDNILQEIWANVIRIKLDAFNETKKKGEEAADKLKKIVETEPVSQ